MPARGVGRAGFIVTRALGRRSAVLGRRSARFSPTRELLTCHAFGDVPAPRRRVPARSETPGVVLLFVWHRDVLPLGWRPVSRSVGAVGSTSVAWVTRVDSS